VATYRDLFRVREFRHLYAGQALSYLGDQLGAIAVAALVFGRTGSGLLTAVAYAAAWLPGIIGGPLLATYADRLPRRQVLIVCDVARAVLVAVLALPAVPVWAAIVLLYVTHLFSMPFVAARGALMPEVLAGDAYVLGNGLGNITFQLTQLGGFAAGGLVVAGVGPRWALVVNAATFAVSALLIVAGVGRRPAPERGEPVSVARDFTDGLRYLLADRWLRGCLLVVCSASAFSYAPEGIAFPFAAGLGGGAATAGLLLAAPALGFVAGALLLTRLVAPARRDRLLVPFAVLSTAALVPMWWSPDLPAALVLLTVAGAGAAFAAPLNAVFVRRVDPGYRGRAMGVAQSALLAGQGLAFLAAGAAVQAGLAPATVIALAGTAGTVVVLAGSAAWRTPRRSPSEAVPVQSGPV
jgi:predicted MFS family arabinose efflux permease